MNYYNDNDPGAVAWLRELIKHNLIPAGDVDERSITDVTGADLKGYTQCHFFAGIGGWSEALRLAGWSTDCPVWTGSCPCQPFSSAGKRQGEKDKRHLWPEFYRLIRECKPVTVFGEQVERAIGLGWLDGVFTDLEAQNYTCGAAVLGAHSTGAPHIRQRLYWVGDANSERWHGWRIGELNLPNKKSSNKDAGYNRWNDSIWLPDVFGKLRRFPCGYEFMANGVFKGTSLSRGIGNAIVPQVAAEFIKAYIEVRGIQ
jgi:DNA (cytosine-5)-methyltransferase 1